MIKKISSYQSNAEASAAELKNKMTKAWQQLNERKDLGFLRLPESDAILETQKLAQELRSRNRHLVVIGIGGSGLGARMIDEIFCSSASQHQLHFCDNVDPVSFNKMMDGLELKDCVFAAVSKSGKTVETLVGIDFICQALKRRSLDWKKHFVVISELKKNPLSNWARENQLPLLEIPEDVGGRFSVLSPVGLLPAAFLGVQLDELRRGARAAFDLHDQIIDLSCEAFLSWQRSELISVFWNYSSMLKNFGLWLQQLWAESLSKKNDLHGHPGPIVSTPIPALGACDQHSVLQQIIEGQKDKWVVFTRVAKLADLSEKLEKTNFVDQEYFVGKKMGQLLDAEARATHMALSESGVSNLVLEISDLDPYSVGELLMFWQLVVANLGQVLEINAFDQPGVELGKRLARKILQSE